MQYLTYPFGDERHMLLECPALADLRLQFSSLLLSCSSVMRRLLWAQAGQTSCWSLELLALTGCHRTDVTLPHSDAIPSDQPCWLPGMSKFSFLPWCKAQCFSSCNMLGRWLAVGRWEWKGMVESIFRTSWATWTGMQGMLSLWLALNVADTRESVSGNVITML